MSNVITPDELRDWAAESDEGEEVVLGSKVLRHLADRIEELEGENYDLRRSLGVEGLGPPK